MSQLVASASRHWNQRRAFLSFGDWLLSIIDVGSRFFNHRVFRVSGGIRHLSVVGWGQPFYFRLGSSDGAVIEEIFIKNIYGLVCDNVGEANLIIDAGANVGYSVALWRKYFPAARIIAVEPDSNNCKILRLNLGDKSENKNVTIAETCLAATSGQVYLDRSGDECAYRMTRTPSRNGEPVAAQTFLEIVASSGDGSVIDLFKCDIEGAESEIFADCSAWINLIHYIAIELHPPYTRDSFVADIERNGGRFEVVPLAENERDDLFMARNLSIGSGSVGA